MACSPGSLLSEPAEHRQNAQDGSLRTHAVGLAPTDALGLSVGPPLGGDIFTCLAFPTGPAAALEGQHLLYVGAASGAVYVVSLISCFCVVASCVCAPIASRGCSEGQHLLYSEAASGDDHVKSLLTKPSSCATPSLAPSLPAERYLAGSRHFGNLGDRAHSLRWQVDYMTRSVLHIVQLHQAPINALAVHERTCFSAADDGHLRMWPLDFAHISLEASHASPVTAVRLFCALATLCCSKGWPGQ